MYNKDLLIHQLLHGKENSTWSQGTGNSRVLSVQLLLLLPSEEELSKCTGPCKSSRFSDQQNPLVVYTLTGSPEIHVKAGKAPELQIAFLCAPRHHSSSHFALKILITDQHSQEVVLQARCNIFYRKSMNNRKKQKTGTTNMNSSQVWSPVIYPLTPNTIESILSVDLNNSNSELRRDPQTLQTLSIEPDWKTKDDDSSTDDAKEETEAPSENTELILGQNKQTPPKPLLLQFPHLIL